MIGACLKGPERVTHDVWRRARWGKVAASRWQLVSCETPQVTNQPEYIFRRSSFPDERKDFFFFIFSLDCNIHTFFDFFFLNRKVYQKCAICARMYQANTLMACYEQRQGQKPFKVCPSKDFHANLMEAKRPPQKRNVK